jgi:hypothetical protein
VQVGAEADNLLGGRCCLLDFCVAASAEPQLLSMERRSVGAVRCLGRTECNERFLFRR